MPQIVLVDGVGRSRVVSVAVERPSHYVAVHNPPVTATYTYYPYMSLPSRHEAEFQRCDECDDLGRRLYRLRRF